MPFDWGQVGMQAANMATGGLFGAVGNMIGGNQQVKQQRKLIKDQEESNKRMYDYGQYGSYEMWKKTGPVGMMKQLKEAGLNPALMYGGGGAGGGTTGSTSPSGVSGATAENMGGNISAGMGMALQSANIAAQTKLIEAQTKNVEANTTKTSGVDTDKTKTEIADLTQGIANKKAQEQLTRVQQRIASIDEVVKGDTLDETVDRIVWESQRALEELDQVARETFIKKATMNDKIATVKAEMIGAFLKNAMMKAGISKTEAETADIARQAVQRWKALEIQGRNSQTQANAQEQDAWINDVQKSTGLPVEVLKEGFDGILRRK